MLSISRYLNSSSKHADDHRRALSCLLEALAVHSIDLPGAERTGFQKELRQLNQRLDEARQPGECLLITGQIIQTIQAFHRETEELSAAHAREMQGIIDLLTRSLLGASKASSTAAESLRNIEKRLERATMIEDIRSLRIEMKGVLQSIQNEARLQELQVAGVRQDLTLCKSEPAVRSVPTALVAPSDNDELTGLSSARMAEMFIRSLEKEGACFHPVVFLVERLDLINNRYGFKAGDQILMHFSQLLAQILHPKDQLFRWRGSSFIGVFERPNTLELRGEIQRFMSRKIEIVVNVEGRGVMMTISVLFKFLPSSTQAAPDEILHRIDSFIAEHPTRPAPLPH